MHVYILVCLYVKNIVLQGSTLLFSARELSLAGLSDEVVFSPRVLKRNAFTSSAEPGVAVKGC